MTNRHPSRCALVVVIASITAVVLTTPRKASAQVSFDVVHTFSGVEAPRAPGSLILAADGNFYGVSRVVFPASAAIVRLTPAGHISIVHRFSAAEGTNVTALLQASDLNFYGATSDGGASGVGTIFRLTPAGTFTMVHHFSGRPYFSASGDDDGAGPSALVLANDGNFYGVTSAGGSATNATGTFFRMTPAGTVSVIHSFTELSNPSTLMQASDGNFYGGTSYRLFKVTPGGAVTVLTTGLSFGGSTASDYSPSTMIEGTDGNLYGTTMGICSFSRYCGPGEAFKLTPAGQVTVLHTFETEGRPNAAFLQVGSVFYGTTSSAVFKMTVSGTVTVVHAFSGGAEDGSDPSRLVRSADGSLYGTTNVGGTLSLGTMFRIAADDTLTHIVTSFSDGPPDGAVPTAALTIGDDGNFYGTSSAGGTFGLGTIFKLTSDGTLTVLHNFAGGADGAGPYAPLIKATDGNFYGTTYNGGGSANEGTVFRLTAAGTVTVVHRFAGGSDGGSPYAPLIQAADGSLYGTTSGTIFRMPLDGPVTTVRQLDANVEGVSSYAALVQGTDGKFYGSTTRGLVVSPGPGFNFNGTIFRMMLDGSVTVLHAFDGSQDGYSPHGALARASDGNFYGTTTIGGTIFRITPAGTFTVLHNLDTSTEGSRSEAMLLQAADGNLYGVTSHGGVPGTATEGAIFQTTLSGKVAVLHAFSGGPDGANPVGGLIQTADGTLYGTTRAGAAGVGVVFRLRVTPQAPVIVIQPSNRSVKAGRPAVFTVAATGLPAPSFQWQVSTDAGGSWTSVIESVRYRGALTSSLTVTATLPFNGYQFRVVASNMVGSATSSAAAIAVRPNVFPDVDGDGKADLVIFRPAGGNWFDGSISGRFLGNRQWGLSGDVPIAGDFGGVGTMDRVVYRPATGTWYVAPSAASPFFALKFGEPGDTPAPGDYDGDGKMDPAFYRPSSGVWHVLTSSSNYNTFAPMTVGLGLSTDIPVPADYDGDGRTDVAVYRPSTGMWYLRLSSTGEGRAFQWGLPGDVPVPADFDGDSLADLAVYRPATGMWYIRQSATNFTTFVSYQWGLSTDIATPADYDGDGQTDLAVFRPATGQWFILESTTHFTSPVIVQWGSPGDVPVPNAPVAYAMAAARGKATVSALASLTRASDIDGDGRADLTVYRASTGTWFTAQSANNYAPSLPATASLGVSTDLPVTGDFDGDGKTDVAVYTPSTGVWSIRRTSFVFTSAALVTYQWGLNGDVPVPGDYDGDGRTDLMVYRPANGVWYLLTSSTNFTSSTAIQWGLPGDVPSPGDYDGDGVTDLAVYRPPTGVWYIKLSTTAYETFVTFQWGVSGAISVPGDYDGDGKTDLAVYLPSANVWYILQSSTNYAAFVTYQWGLSGDIPVPGDFDGDGKSDVAVWRPSHGVWYFLRSSTNSTTSSSFQWGLPGDIPILGRP